MVQQNHHQKSETKGSVSKTAPSSLCHRLPSQRPVNGPAGERQSIEAAIVATTLQYPEDFADIVTQIHPEYFGDSTCRRTFEVQTEIHKANTDPSMQNVLASGKLSREDQDELIAHIVHQERRTDLRILIRRLSELEAQDRLRRGLSQALGTTDVFKSLQITSTALTAADAVIQGTLRRSKEARLAEVRKRLDDKAVSKCTPIPTFFPIIDAMLKGGLSPAGVSFLGGYPGEGKTSFALTIAVNAARQGIPTLVVEGEMMEMELHSRAARTFHGPEREHLDAWLDEYARLPLDIFMLSERTPRRLLGCLEQAANNGSRLLVVDYMQAFAALAAETDRYFQSIKLLSAELRALALRQSERGNFVHIMALSSLNRSEASAGRPTLASLYGSSGLAHDCTEAFIIYSGNDKEARMSEMRTGYRSTTIEIVKARAGIRGPISFEFHGASQRFSESPDHEERASSGVTPIRRGEM